jgi:hypothetical protein
MLLDEVELTFHRVPNERALSCKGEEDKVVGFLVWGIFFVLDLCPRGGCVGYLSPPCFGTESFITFCRVPNDESSDIIW